MKPSPETIPLGTYQVKRLAAYLNKKGFDYVLIQKFEITEGPYKGRRLQVRQELDDSNVLELREDAPPI